MANEEERVELLGGMRAAEIASNVFWFAALDRRPLVDHRLLQLEVDQLLRPTDRCAMIFARLPSSASSWVTEPCPKWSSARSRPFSQRGIIQFRDQINCRRFPGPAVMQKSLRSAQRARM